MTEYFLCIPQGYSDRRISDNGPLRTILQDYKRVLMASTINYRYRVKRFASDREIIGFDPASPGSDGTFYGIRHPDGSWTPLKREEVEQYAK